MYVCGKTNFRNMKTVFLIVFGFISFGNAQSPCITPNGEQAQCISIYKCQIFLNALSNRTSETVRFLRESRCGYVEDPLVCCGSVARYENVAVPTTPTSATTRNLDLQSHRNFNLIPTRGNCGIQALQDKIFGGNETGLDEFPWMAILEYRKNGKSVGHNCGGVLINQRYVLTAAHCIVGEIKNAVGDIFRVRLGEYNKDTEEDCVATRDGTPDCSLPPQDIDIEEAIAHVEYSEVRNRYHDIGLLRLSKPVKYNDFVKPICLPTNNEQTSPGKNLTVAGWGYTEKKIYSPIKLKVNVPLVSETRCSNVFSSRFNVKISDNQLCAGGEPGRDSCNGDSGGPLMTTYPKREDFYVEGIVSFGASCGTEGVPGIYTKVSRYLNWILDNMKPF